MARRSDHSRDQIYQMALEAAGGIVDAEGWRALTARRIGTAIGYSPGTLYNVFENLDDLILHLNGNTLDRLTETLGKPDVGASVEDNLLALLDRYLAFGFDFSRRWNMLFEHTLPPEKDLPSWYRVKIDIALHVVETALDPLFPEERAKDRRLAAETLWASLHGISALAQVGNLQTVTTMDSRSMAGNLIRTYLAGLEIGTI